MADPPLIASGRSADVFDLGDGRVLRRRRDGDVFEHEIAAMRAAKAAGYPVPEVLEVRDTEVVFERVDGEEMVARLARRPWEIVRTGRELGALHLRLAAVDADLDGLPTRSEPVEVLIHGDLHPANVMLTDDGPVVIDWEGAGAGPRGDDAATTWLLMTIASTDDVPAALRPLLPILRRLLLRGFFSVVDRPSPVSYTHLTLPTNREV